MPEVLRGRASASEIIVAGADCPSRIKSIAHLRCDGTNDEVEINAAVAELGTRGGRVRLIGAFEAEGINIKQRVHFVGDNFGTTISLPSGASESMFKFPSADDGAVFTGGGIHGIWCEGGNQEGRHCVDFSDLNESLVEFDISYCFINNFDIGVRFAQGGDRLPRVANTRIWNCDTGIFVGEHPQISDSEIRFCGLGIAGPVNDCFISDTKIAECGVGLCYTTSDSGYTPTSLANTQIIVSGASFATTAINGYAYFPTSGNFYPITAVPGATELTVTGDPSAETGKFYLASLGTVTTTVTGCLFFWNKIGFILGNGSTANNIFFLNGSTSDAICGAMVRGNAVMVNNSKWQSLSTSYGWSDGCVRLKMTGSSTVMQNVTLQGNSFQNKAGYHHLTFAAPRWIDGLLLSNNHFALQAGSSAIRQDAWLRGANISNNLFQAFGIVGDACLDVASPGSTHSNMACSNMLKLETSATATGMLGGNWTRGTITGNHISGGSTTIPVVESGATTTSAVIANNNEQ